MNRRQRFAEWFWGRFMAENPFVVGCMVFAYVMGVITTMLWTWALR